MRGMSEGTGLCAVEDCPNHTRHGDVKCFDHLCDEKGVPRPGSGAGLHGRRQLFRPSTFSRDAWEAKLDDDRFDEDERSDR